MTARNEKGHFLPGTGGRQRGSKNKLHADFIEKLAKDFAEHGEEVIRIVRAKQPSVYLKVIASVLPREFLFTDSKLDDMSEDELLEALALIREEKAKANTEPVTEH